ncbi:hypothetical protein [Paenibacillus marinisediminis]
MKAGRRLRQIVQAVMGCVLALSATPVLAVSGHANGSSPEKMTPTASIDAIAHQKIGFVDKEDGTIYYVVEPAGSHDRSYIVERTPDGTLMRWEDKYEAIYNAGGRQPIVSVNASEMGVKYDYNQTYYYDTQDDKMHQGQFFNSSPDGKWGVTKQILWHSANSAEDGRTHISMEKSYWLKNNATGEINEWFSSYNTSPIYWMPDNKLLVERYSEQAKQNEIDIYDPVTNHWSFVKYASLRGYNANSNSMIYTLNEPKRTEHVYDFKTQRSHVLTGQVERDQITSSAEEEYKDLPQLDKKLITMSLPVKSIALVHDQYHVVHIGGQDVAVDYIFNKNDNSWIPVKPLLDALGWKLEVQETSGKQSQYVITSDQGRIELTPDNSLIVKDRLFITPSQLQSLGYSNVSVTANVK